MTERHRIVQCVPATPELLSGKKGMVKVTCERSSRKEPRRSMSSVMSSAVTQSVRVCGELSGLGNMVGVC